MKERIKQILEKTKRIIIIISCILGLIIHVTLSIPLAFSYLLMLKPNTARRAIEDMFNPSFSIKDY